MKKTMKQVFTSAIAFALLLGNVASADAQSTPNNVVRNVMYYADWSVWGSQDQFYPADLPANMYTHLNFAFLDFNADGTLVFTDKDAASGNNLGQNGVTWGDINSGILPALRALRAEHPNMKIGISLGGWSRSGDFSRMAANATYRANFVKNVLKYVEYTSMDFVDIDWEYPAFVRQPDTVDLSGDEGTPHSTAADKENYITLLSDLRTALDAQGRRLGKTYELSVALPVDKRKLEAGVDIQRMFEIIDFGNMMTYDARGAFDPTTGHHSALYGNPADEYYDYGFNIDSIVKYMVAQGAPANKVVIGSAFYSRGWEDVENVEVVSGLPGLFATANVSDNRDADNTPSRGALNDSPAALGDGGRLGGIWAFRNFDELHEAYPGLVEYWDDVSKAAYLFNGKSLFTIDSKRSIAEKAKYVHANNLGGIITWMASNDDVTTVPKQRDELTKAVYEGLYGNAALPQHEIVEGDLDINVSVTVYDGGWGSDGYEITITNNETANEQGEVLTIVEAQKETVMLPKFYINNNGIPLVSGGYGTGTVTQENGLTVLDLSSVYDNKLLPQGASITLKLAQPSGELSVSNLKSIKMTQRVYEGSVELAEQYVYGNSGGEVTSNKAPTISGVAPVTLNVGDTFNARTGVAANDAEDGDLTSAIVVSGSVNTNIANVYNVIYTVTDSDGARTSVTRVVTVVEPTPNTAAVISGANNVSVPFGQAFDVRAGVTAYDNEDGDLTKWITVSGTVNVNIAGDYTITYSVTDGAGLTSIVRRVVTVVAASVNNAPTFTGVSNVSVSLNSAFDVLSGVSATDKEDGDVTEWITVSGTVNTSIAAVYTLTYSVVDSEGLTTTVKRIVTVTSGGTTNPDVDEIDFGVGEGIVWPSHIFAPFADMGAWVTDPTYSNNGALNLGQIMDDTGVKYFNLGFITAVDHSVTDGVLHWGFASSSMLNENNPANTQYLGIKKAIKDVRDRGGDVVISIGGALERNFFQYSTDLDVIVNTYVNIIDGFNLTRIDLDIEGGAQGKELNRQNAQAMKIVQDRTGVEVVLTLPVLPSGLTPVAVGTVEAYLEAGVDIKLVNIMAMAYGSYYGQDYGTRSVEAIDSTMAQIKTMYAAIGTHLSDAEAYDKVGVITSVGFETGIHPIFTVANSQLVVDHSIEKQVGMLSFWSINRDSKTQANDGINEKYEHTKIYIAIDGDSTITPPPPSENTAPVIYGVVDQTIEFGSSFNAMQGVTASDKEDGNLTTSIVITGSVNTNVAGRYTLTYKVTDSKGLSSEKVAHITVKEEVVTPPPTNTKPVLVGVRNQTVEFGSIFDAMKDVTATDNEDGNITHLINVAGTVNTNVSSNYTIVYSVIDSGGLQTSEVAVITVKEEVVLPPTDGEAVPWTRADEAAGKHIPGFLVSHKGKIYEQVSGSTSWWNEPGTNASVWKEVGVDDGYVEPAPSAWSREGASQGLYTPGTKVTHNGVTYLQISKYTEWWVEPGTNPSIWQRQ